LKSKKQPTKPLIRLSYDVCQPQYFTGRLNEKKILITTFSNMKNHGKTIVIYGIYGSGKTSLLNWMRHNIVNKYIYNSTLIIDNAFSKLYYDSFSTLIDFFGNLKNAWESLNDNKVIKNTLENYFNHVFRILKQLSPNDYLIPTGIDYDFARADKTISIYNQPFFHLLKCFHEILHIMSLLLCESDRNLVIFFDNVQWANQMASDILQRVICRPPPRIGFLLAYDTKNNQALKWPFLQQKTSENYCTKLRLQHLTANDIEKLILCRLSLVLHQKICMFLAIHIGYPIQVITVFNILNLENLTPTYNNIIKAAGRIKNTRGFLYPYFNDLTRKIIDAALVLKHPLSITQISYLIKATKRQKNVLKKVIEKSGVFKSFKNEFYDIVHPLLYIYCDHHIPYKIYKNFNLRSATFLQFSNNFPFSKIIRDTLLANYLYRIKSYKKALEYKYKLCRHYKALHEYEYAMHLIYQARVCARITKNKNVEASCLLQIGDILFHTGKLHEAIEAYSQNIKIEREMKNHQGIAIAFFKMGLVFEYMNRLDTSILYYNKSKKIERKFNNLYALNSIFHRLGVAYQLMNNFSIALKYYVSSLNIAKQLDDFHCVALSYHQIGRIYHLRNNFNIAMDYYCRSIAINNKIKNPYGKALTLYQISLIFQKNQCFDKAIICLKNCLTTVRLAGLYNIETHFLYQIGSNYQLMHNFNKSLFYLKKSQKISEMIGIHDIKVRILYQIGKTYHLMKNYDLALCYYNYSNEIARHYHDTSMLHLTNDAITSLKQKM